VGVVRDAKYQTLREPVMKTMSISWLQWDGDQPTRCNCLARVGTVIGTAAALTYAEVAE
jgi:hypothetical protein